MKKVCHMQKIFWVLQINEDILKNVNNVKLLM